MRHLGLAVTAALCLAACSDGATTAPTLETQPLATVIDGGSGGNPHFFFLSPLTRTADYSGTFDASLSPVVRISVDGSVVAELPAAVDQEDELYQANWHTRSQALPGGTVCHLAVWADDYELGSADVVLVDNGRQRKDHRSADLVVVQNGSTLPIKFRIEEGAIPASTGEWAKMQIPDGIGTLYTVWGTSSTDVFAGGIEGRPDLNESPGAILHFDGTSWTKMQLPEGTGWVFSISGTSSHDVYATALRRLLHFDGSTWSVVLGPAGQGSPEYLWSVWAGSPDNVVVVGAQGRVLHFDGSTWSEEGGFTGADLLDVSGSGSRVLASAGSDLFQRQVGGSWTQLEVPPVAQPNGILGLYVASPTRAFVLDWWRVGTFDGTSWSFVGLPTYGDYKPGGQAVWASSDQDVVVVGGLGCCHGATPMVETFDGASWSQEVVDQDSGLLYAVWGTPDARDVFAVGGDLPATIFRRRH